MAWRNIFWGLCDAMVKSPDPWVSGAVQPNLNYGMAYRFLAACLPSNQGNRGANDLRTPELRPYLDRYLRGSSGYDAIERVKPLKLLLDAVGSEFGGRHELR